MNGSEDEEENEDEDEQRFMESHPSFGRRC
jgi:hypothetical protein